MSPHRLTLTGRFPARARASEAPTFDGTVTVINATGERVEGLAAVQPDVFVMQSGRPLTAPVPRAPVGTLLDLAPGAAKEFTATGSLRRPDEQPLPPGRYEIHAVLRVFRDGDPSPAGGPWPLE